MTDDKKEYVLRKRGCFFRPGAQGYTIKISEAGRFSERDAADYAKFEGVTMHRASEYETKTGETPMNKFTPEEIAELNGAINKVRNIDQTLRDLANRADLADQYGFDIKTKIGPRLLGDHLDNEEIGNLFLNAYKNALLEIRTELIMGYGDRVAFPKVEIWGEAK